MERSDRNDRPNLIGDEQESGRLGRAAEKTRETVERAKDGLSAGATGAAEKARDTLEKAKDGLSAGAAGAAELTRNVASGTRDRAGRAVEFVRDAETDTELKARVADTTERSLNRAGDRLTDAAPAIGRGAEKTAEKVGQALHLVGHPLAVLLGAIAGTLGGWWNKAREERLEFPESEDAACRAHFTALAVVPGGMTYDRARTGYALGYVASRNPGYRGRAFEEIEPELRRGFGEQHAADFETLREFTRYGYGRGLGVAR